MAVIVNEHLILGNEGTALEFYLNDKDEIFACAEGDMAGMFWFVIDRDDWKELKQFIDKQFET